MICLNLGEEDFDVVRSLTQLNELYIAANKLTDISFLGNLTNLRMLGMSSAVAHNGAIYFPIEFHSSGEVNVVEDFTPLSKLSQLEILRMSGSSCTDLSWAAGLTKLEEIRSGNNKVTDFTPLNNRHNLKTLYVSYNKIVDVSSMSGLVSLESLSLEHNKVRDLTPLSGLINLKELNLGYKGQLHIARIK